MTERVAVDPRFVAIDGLRIRYERGGRGPSVLLLHGTTSSLEHFDLAASILGDSFDVIRLDLPGFGMTGPRRDRDYRIGTYADTVARFMQALDVKRYAIVGNSLGGNIAWNVALDFPDRLTALVLVNATGYPEKQLPQGMRLARHPLLRPVLRRLVPRGMVERGLRQAVGPGSDIVDDVMIDRVHRFWNRPGNRSAFVDFVNTEQADRSNDIASIAVPTLVLRSAEVDGQSFAHDIAHSREAICPTGGHLLPEEQPVWFANSLTAFLSSLRLETPGDQS
jgi:pimeloyl-ACP methyl ester carboxylesterase